MRRFAFAGLVSALLILIAVPLTVTATPERPDDGPRPQRTPRPDRPDRTPRPDRSAAPVVEPGPWLVEPRTAIQVAYSDPSVLARAPLLVASLAGYFTGAGLEEVTIIEVRDPLAAVRDGDVDFAIVDTSDAAEAVAEDPSAPRLLAGHRDTASDDGDAIVAKPGLVANEPATAIAFLTAYIRGLQDLSDPETAADALALIEATELTLDPEVADGWDDSVAAYGPFDGGFGPLDDEGGLGALGSFLESAGIAVDAETLVDAVPLNIAQSNLGLDTNPASALAGGPGLTDVTVGMSGGVAGGGPIVAADEGGHFEDAGFTSVEVTDVEQPLAGLTLGELDFAVLPAAEAADAIAQGLPIVAIAGHRNYATDGSYGGDVLVTSTDQLTSEGPTVAAFLSAYIRGLRDLAESETGSAFAPHDGGFGDRAQDGGLGELSAYLTDALGAAPDLGAVVAAGPITFAQAGLGLPANPTDAADATTATPEASAPAGEEATS